MRIQSTERGLTMRYVIASIAAILVALAVTVFVSPPLTGWVLQQFTYESPDSVDDLDMLVFMAINVSGLIAGWLLGWAIGGAFEKDDPVE